jgi:hypothetical protein
LARASRLHRGGRGFEPPSAHQIKKFMTIDIAKHYPTQEIPDCTPNAFGLSINETPYHRHAYCRIFGGIDNLNEFLEKVNAAEAIIAERLAEQDQT